LQAALQEAPSKITLRVALAEMLTFVGRYVEAERQIALISDADPSNKELLVLRNQLAVLSGAKRQ
jgi:protein involved in temperature-dependent protein secretion